MKYITDALDSEMPFVGDVSSSLGALKAQGAERSLPFRQGPEVAADSALKAESPAMIQKQRVNIYGASNLSIDYDDITRTDENCQG